MVIIYRIFSAFAYLSAVGVLVLGVFDFRHENPQIERISKQPGIIERFEETCDKQDKPAEESSPLVVQARAFSSFLNPPRPIEEKENVLVAAEHTPSRNTPPIRKPSPPAPSAKFKVLGTSYYPNQPERSMALIWQPGSKEGFERWVKEGSRLGHFLVYKIKRGIIVYRDNREQLYEMAIEKKNNTNSLVKKHIPGLTIAQGHLSLLSAPSSEPHVPAVAGSE
ncbi:MAG: hypothetical protein GY774_28250 [Planctomycetes bacterium]|nr:hypothetical protein [Planctomycetota bacterium]